jgi:hypothetical protein
VHRRGRRVREAAGDLFSVMGGLACYEWPVYPIFGHRWQTIGGLFLAKQRLVWEMGGYR